MKLILSLNEKVGFLKESYLWNRNTNFANSFLIIKESKVTISQLGSHLQHSTWLNKRKMNFAI